MTPVPLLLRRHAGSILLLAAVAAVVTAIVVPRLPPGVDAVLTFTVHIPERPPSGEYEFDGFYALQATDLFAETLAGWMTSPQFVAEVYSRTGLPQPAASVRQLGRVFTARKVSGQLVELKFRARAADDAARLSREASIVLGQRTERFNAAGKGSQEFSAVSAEPLIIPVRRSAPLRALVSALITAVVAANILLFWDAMKTTENASPG